MTDFVHLHLHTEFSLLDGACRIKGLIQLAKEQGMKAVAITDHGVMYGAVDFYNEAVANGIKPIIGCEVYVAPRTRFDRENKIDNHPYHLILLCKDMVGYKNLIWLVSRAFTEGFYAKPRIDRELLQGHTDGLICLSACLAGELPRKLLAEDYEGAKEAALFYRDLFGKDNYYIELQNHGMKEQLEILPKLVRLADEIGVEIVATNDCHYLTKEDAKMQNLLVCIQTGHTVNDEMDLEFPSDDWYVKSGDEMAEIFKGFPRAIENTVNIAERCNIEFVFGKTILPYFAPPTGEENEAYFRRLCQEGLIKRYQTPSQEAIDRLEYEIETIKRMGYIDYYLIVQDFIMYAKSQGIPVGPGRGSGAGSIAAYCIGITNIDPLRFNLLFERFLNPERVSMPDFDVDFCYVRRQEVIDYVNRKYGSDHVAQIVTFGTMAAKQAIRDVGRAMGMPYAQVNNVAKQIPNELKITIDKALEKNKDFRDMCEADATIRELVDTARKVEGFPRHASTHAAGVVITRDPVDSYVPLALNDSSVVAQYTMTTLERLGLLKMDFLGLRNLTVIDDTIKAIHATKDPDFDINQIPENDPGVYEMISKGDSIGVFQLESSGMRDELTKLKPASIEDLTAVISLYRPGPMDFIPRYNQNRQHPDQISYATPQLKKILEVTYGCMVYQEQVMQICRELGGYSLGQADNVRRAMSKKKIDVMAKERVNFVDGCLKNGITQSAANEIFDEMSGFAEYAFNKSHATAYAYVSYQTAYLKYHYTKEYMAALLTSVLDTPGKLMEYMDECTRLHIQVLPPDINKSYTGFTVTDEGIRYGLLAVKNLGEGVIRSIIQIRAEKPFTDFVDFYRRVYSTDINKRSMESLIKSGALDSLAPTRKMMLQGYEQVASVLDEQSEFEMAGQLSFFGNEGQPSAIELPYAPEFEKRDLLDMEKEVTGMYLSGHPLAEYESEYQRLGAIKISQLVSSENSNVQDDSLVHVLALVSSRKNKMTKKNDMMAFLTLEDVSGTIEALVFPKVLPKISGLLQENAILYFTARTAIRDDEENKLYLEDAVRVQDAIPPVSKNQPVKNKATEGLYLKVVSMEDKSMEKVKEILQIFEGNIPVYFRTTADGKMLIAPKEYWTEPNDVLIEELKKLLGSDSVYLKN